MITTHILDTSLGKPASGVSVRLERAHAGSFDVVGQGFTDSDGRLRTLCVAGAELEAGVYKLHFETGDYFRNTGRTGFYPYVEVVFELHEKGGHYHVPLLLNPFGYSTYRGS